MPPSLCIIYASTSGNTEYVVETLVALLREQASNMRVDIERAERANADDLTRGDALILGSGTWNTNGIEGQLNEYMDELLFTRAKDIDLTGRPMAFISLGDERYYYTVRCTEHFQRFRRKHGGTQLLPPLIIVNEPYGQEERIGRWGRKLLSSTRKAPL